ncbi:MAG TPA: c-type cytochrome domain-containing protein, partial [Gemmataceae bacterium]|nr:c-type cytochrome domain-containing protein [Gemmataceae bacterium]
MTMIARAILLCILSLALVARADAQIAIDVPVRTRPVDFDAEIVPILRANCIACHNAKKKSGGLNLESPESMRKGGEQGPAVVAGKGGDSLLLKLAAHQQKPMMPPAGNKVDAKALRPAELGLLKLWIDQGATASVSAKRDVKFLPLPTGYQPSFAAAITPDGQYAVASRGNRLFVYHVPTAKLAATLVDPNLDGNVAHRDIVRSLAFDPAGDVLASGAFREVKLWRRPRPRELAQCMHDAPVHAVAVSADGKSAATGDEAGRIRIWEIASGKSIREIAAHQAAVTGLAFSADGAAIYSASLDKSLASWTVVDGKSAGKTTVGQALHGMILANRGASVVTGDAEGNVHIWDGAALRNASAKPSREIKAHKKIVTALATIPGADAEFLSGGADGFVRRWNVVSGEKIREVDNGAPVMALAVRLDGKQLATAGPDFVKLWPADANKALTQIQGDPRLMTKVSRLDAEIALAKALINRTKNDLKSYEGLERAVKVTAENVKKAEAELAKAEKLRDEKKAALVELTAKTPKNDKSADAAQKAAAEAETAVGVALTTIERMKATAKDTAEKLSATQKDLAAREQALKRQEAAKAAALAAAKASRQPVGAIAFSPDGQRLAVGCVDGTLHFYHAENASPVESLANHRSAIRA